MPREDLMRRAIALAVDNVRAGTGGPFGALVVCGEEIIAQGVNRVTRDNDPTAHAEIVAIREACSRLGRFDLRGCEIYSSCEPCPMCLGAIYWARLDGLYFACGRRDASDAGFDDALIYEELARELAGRSLITRQLLRAEGLAAFRAWGESEGKTPY